VSVIVVSFNGWAHTEHVWRVCGATHSGPILKTGGGQRLSGWTAQHLQALASQEPRLQLILNDRNLGFAAANNQALRRASGEYFVLLNNDTSVTPGWLGRLIWHLEKNQAIGLIGP